MFNNLQALGLGLIGFAIIIGVGAVILTELSTSFAGCKAGFNYTDVTNVCQNNTNISETYDPPTSSQTTHYLNGELGTNGLAGWTPAIVAITVGMLFLGVFLARKGGRTA